jgi:ribosomal protein S18 acetylase RimI-like enzyme
MPAVEAAARGKYIFYRAEKPALLDVPLQSGYTCSIWRPSMIKPWPRGTRGVALKMKFLGRTLLYRLGFFSTSECGAVCIFDEARRLVHYSTFAPQCHRFPFLEREDLEIEDTWTDPAHRGKGFAQFALCKVMRLQHRPGRRFWYVVDAANAPSIAIARKIGFEMVSEGKWHRPLGLNLASYYRMTRPSLALREQF